MFYGPGLIDPISQLENIATFVSICTCSLLNFFECYTSLWHSNTYKFILLYLRTSGGWERTPGLRRSLLLPSKISGCGMKYSLW